MSRWRIFNGRNVRAITGTTTIKNRRSALIVRIVLGRIGRVAVIVGVGQIGDRVGIKIRSDEVVVATAPVVAVVRSVEGRVQRDAGIGGKSARTERGDAGRSAVNRASAESGRRHRCRWSIDLRLKTG